jgi:hypothetical protein
MKFPLKTLFPTQLFAIILSEREKSLELTRKVILILLHENCGKFSPLKLSSLFIHQNVYFIDATGIAINCNPYFFFLFIDNSICAQGFTLNIIVNARGYKL